MKVLINESFKALRTGEFVSADENAGEFILDTSLAGDDQPLAVSTLMEVVAANKLKGVKKGKKDDVIAAMEKAFGELKLPTQNKKPDSQIVAEIVAAGIEEKKDDEDMLVEIIQAGIKFKNAGKLFKQAMEAGGYRITAKKRKEEIRAILVDEEFAPEEYSEVSEMMDRLAKEIPDTTQSQAFSVIKAYAKEFELEIPKPVKKAVGGFRGKAMDWMVQNPEASKDDLSEWIEEQGKDDPEGKLLDRTYQLFQFGKRMYKAAK